MKENDRIKIGNRVSMIGICCNIILAALKILIGVISGMISVLADGVNNFSDAIASVVSLVGFKLSSRPADDEHPFGHARYEYISGLAVSFLVMLAGVELLQNSIQKILNPTDAEVSSIILIVLVLSILVKLGMAFMYYSVGRKIDSGTVVAAAADSRNDCISTSAVLIALVITYFSGINLDGIMGVLVALFVLYSGFALVKETAGTLLGSTPDVELVKNIETKIMSYEGVLGTHDLMVHDYGPGHCFASVHVEVPAERNVLECHEIIDKIEDDCLTEMGINLVIHYDPIVTDNSAVSDLRQFIKVQASLIDESISIHDLRIVPGEENTNVIFDCVIPHALLNRENEIIQTIKSKLADEYPNHRAVIKVDHSFVSLSK